MLLSLGQCDALTDTGPFDAAAEVYPSADVPMIRLKKMWMATQTDQTSRTENYLAPISFADGAHEGGIRLGAPVRLQKDGWGVYSRVVPVQGTSLFIQVQDQFRNQATIDLIDPSHGKATTLATIRGKTNERDDGAYAVTRSGSHLLLVAPNKITLRDITHDREVSVEASPLEELRAALIRCLGNPGQWWLTDDLRYVVVEPSSTIWTQDGDSGLASMRTEIAQFAFDPSSQGVIYDLQTKRLASFPSTAGQSALTRLADAEDVGGVLTLLYVGEHEPIGGITAVIADASGRTQASHVIKSPHFTFVVHFAGWQPASRTVWFRTRDAGTDLPDDAPDAPQHLVAWDVNRNGERWYGLSVAQIQRCVSAIGPEANPK